MVELRFFNKLGEMCEKGDDDVYGDFVDLVLNCLDLIFVADECGTNTIMSRDKILSNNKRVTKKGCNVKILSYSRDVHFTTLGITALTGALVFTVIIIAESSPLTYKEIYCFNPDAKWVRDDDIFIQLKNDVLRNDLVLDPDILKQNTGVEKVFPGGSFCCFKGIDISTLIC